MKTMLLVPLVLASTLFGAGPARGAGDVSVRDYPSIHEAIRSNPGRMLHVPDGDHTISEPIVLTADRSGLAGPGRIIQTDPSKPIVRVEGAAGVRLCDLTLTRSEGKRDTETEGVLALGCRGLELDRLRVVDNRTRSAAIALRRCEAARVRDCLVENYQRITVDDRTDNPDLGYAFKCIDGTGISIADSRETLVQSCRIVESRLIPTPELKREFDLGRYVKKLPARGVLAGKSDWDRGATDNWLQGAAIHVASPEATDSTQILGNSIENAAQGIDIHADHVIVAQNIVRDSLIGMKAMHGSRNVLILGNQFSRNTLWSIGLMPGAASHAARPAEGGRPATPANVDGGSIIANNIISDFGEGRSRWVWGDPGGGSPLRFDHGQKPDNPPLTDVLVQGNIVYDTARDGVLVDGVPKAVPPRYRYAVRVESGPTAPRGLHFANNIFHPGSQGVSNVELRP